MYKALGLAVLLLVCAGCAQRSAPSARAPLTERQRDSLIAHSRLPGASVVGRSMAVSDRSARQAAATDAAVDSLFR
jgi:hypothetical protein